MVQWLGLCASTAGGTSSIPGRGTKIPHAAGRGQKLNLKNKKKKRSGQLRAVPSDWSLVPSLARSSQNFRGQIPQGLVQTDVSPPLGPNPAPSANRLKLLFSLVTSLLPAGGVKFRPRSLHEGTSRAQGGDFLPGDSP